MKKMVSLALGLALAGMMSVSVLAATAGQVDPSPERPGSNGATSGQAGSVLDDLANTTIANDSDITRVYSELVTVARLDDFTSANLRGVWANIGSLEAEVAALHPESVPTYNTAPGINLVGGIFARNPLAGQSLVFYADKTDTDAPFAIQIRMTVNGASAQPDVPIFVQVTFPEEMRQSASGNTVSIKHTLDNGTVEYIDPIWVESDGGSITGVTFATNGFSLFEFAIVAAGGGGGGGNNANPIARTSSEAGAGGAVGVLVSMFSVLGTATWVVRRKLAA